MRRLRRRRSRLDHRIAIGPGFAAQRGASDGGAEIRRADHGRQIHRFGHVFDAVIVARHAVGLERDQRERRVAAIRRNVAVGAGEQIDGRQRAEHAARGDAARELDQRRREARSSRAFPRCAPSAASRRRRTRSSRRRWRRSASRDAPTRKRACRGSRLPRRRCRRSTARRRPAAARAAARRRSAWPPPPTRCRWRRARPAPAPIAASRRSPPPAPRPSSTRAAAEQRSLGAEPAREQQGRGGEDRGLRAARSGRAAEARAPSAAARGRAKKSATAGVKSQPACARVDVRREHHALAPDAAARRGPRR